ncbi:hypothetical protein CEE44_04940 [Candidatus Woesearchaeota archaeon B3_Woes]|nr:MAG: hypothetical protein CEE44_04940 [Candidatus Woesearchaeota archaeon B3_Woes]
MYFSSVANKKNWVLNVVITVLILFFLFISGLVGLLTDYLWFDMLGFSSIFLISLKSKVFLFFVGGFVFFFFALFNLWISSKFSEAKKKIISFKTKLKIVSILSFFVGITVSSQWFLLLQYLNQVPFAIKDPIFLKDVSFYIFSLPFFSVLWLFVMACVMITTLLVLFDYLQSFILGTKPINFRQTDGKHDFEAPVPSSPSFDFKDVLSKFKANSTIHLTVLGCLIFILLAIKHYLTLFSVMYSKQGIVVGAGYADVVAYLPIIRILMILAIVVALVFVGWMLFFSKQLKKRHILGYVVLIYLIFGFVGPTIIPGLVQSFIVTPNEINLERPYIENNIKFTRMAYGLSDVEEKDFSVEMDLTSDKLSKASKTIDNVRILDWRPLVKTYKQTQEIRLYYDLSGIDIDRYDINGKYTQVMLAPRELDQNQIIQNAKTWVNIHMVYTHGFGVVMSPVNSVTKEGLPNFFIKDIPPIYTVDDLNIKIDKPQIYYGEKYNGFVLVNTKANEFDYPKGNTNEYINYDGGGGVGLDSTMKKFLMAFKFKDVKLLLSSDITSDSKIMFRRNIIERISKITPFIGLDDDPYLVLHNGSLVWIVDGYTLSGNFPYSEKQSSINYIRNSVKIVVDAYNGDITYYIIDTSDPLIITYAKIFPKQFRLIDSMPLDLKKHIRYPEDLFRIQSSIYNTYHMDDISVFYNKEDAWQIPHEIYGVGQQVKVDPYYIIMKLPGETEEEFVLMTTFTPIKKDNMVAWMAARSDGSNYGKLILYKFPKDKLIYGPLQIEAKFDQDSEISQQITLWSQQGSQVTRGNLLVIPIDNSLLYIEPLYIQSEQGQLPQLKRILVSDGERVVMEESFDLALEALFGKAVSKKVVVEGVSQKDLIKEASIYYDQILDSMNKQDWIGFGTNFDKLGEVLGALR